MKLHLFQFDTEAAAINDPTVSAFHFPGSPGESDPFWDQSVTFPNTGVWITQSPQSGFWIIIATADTNTTLAQHAACRLAWDNESAVVLGGTYTGNDMSALYVSPVPAGAYNPWNGAGPA